METVDEIYLIDMWRVVVREWRWFCATAAVVLIATFGYLHHARPQWEATTWIQIGQLALAPAGQDIKVEPFQRVMERLETPDFQNDVLKSIGVPLDAPEANLFRRSMKLEPLPYASIIKVSLRGYAQQDAAQLATATVAVMSALHEQIGEVPLRMAHDRLNEIGASLKGAEADRARLAQQVAAKDVTASLVLATTNNEIRALEHQRNDMEVRLTPNYSYETTTPWPNSVSGGPVFPNVLLTWGIGVLAAVFFASLVAIGRNALRRGALAAR